MGGSQSQERVVTVEERAGENGDPQITVTQDFLKYIQEQSGGGIPEGEGREPPSYPSEEEEEEEEIPYISAEELLTGESERASSTQQRESNKWKQRFEHEKRKNAELKDITGREFDKAVTEIREKFSKTSLHSWMPVCEQSKDRVLKCYHGNPDHTLNCSIEAKEYMECVEKARQGLLQTSSASE